MRAWLTALTAMTWLAVCVQNAAMADEPASVDFASRIRPIFERNCFKCHGPEKQRGGLRLDVRESVLVGGDSGEPAVVPGKVESSALLERVSSDKDDRRMPPKGTRLSVDEVSLLRRWVAAGASWPAEAKGGAVTRGRAAMVVTAADRDHWSFRPLRPIGPPRTRDAGAVSNPVDDFLNTARKAKNLTPAPEADRPTLIRRVTFDLIGLPPDFDDVTAFAGDRRPDAYERVVDRLLASPQYGERWGRHWLDLARYADSDGYESDLDRKTAYRYRDFVIHALNDDMPFDQFVRWQIAGDELEPGNPRALAATGFCTAAPCQETTPADLEENKEKIRYDELDNMLSTTSSAFLGLTLGCARCHDHKFDPIPTRDYYSMLAAFTTAGREDAPLSRPHRDLERWLRAQHRLYREDRMTALKLSDEEKFWLRQPEHFFVPVQIELYKRFGKTLEATDERLLEWMRPEQRKTWETLKSRLPKVKGEADRGIVLLDTAATPNQSFLLGRGSVMNKTSVVTLGFLQVLTDSPSADDFRARAQNRIGRKSTAEDADDGAPGTTYQRAALAEWLTDVEQGAGGLLARVAVNRIWHHHFGEGLTRTPDDFGTQGEKPVHPELLDWLARELVQGGWRLKPLHRRIVTSAAYRQATAYDPAKAAIDPENRFLWHRRPVRLEAEAIRDAMLAASGRLSPQVYGPSFRPLIPAEAIATRSKDAYPADIRDGPANWRRSVYAFIKRSVTNPFVEVFDSPDSTAACGRRNTTAVPTQNLLLLNDPFVRARARDLAERVSREAGADMDCRVRRAYELALSRNPRLDEEKSAREFLAKEGDQASLTDLCHVLFTLNEFLYVD